MRAKVADRSCEPQAGRAHGTRNIKKTKMHHKDFLHSRWNQILASALRVNVFCNPIVCVIWEILGHENDVSDHQVLTRKTL